jgi:hypothetical protein
MILQSFCFRVDIRFRYLPRENTSEDHDNYLVDHEDPGLRANPEMPNLCREGVTIDDFTPVLGTSIEGVQLTEMSPEALDEVALLGEYLVETSWIQRSYRTATC